MTLTIRLLWPSMKVFCPIKNIFFKKPYEISFYSSLVRNSAFREYIEKIAEASKLYLASPLEHPIVDWDSGII